MGQEAAAAVLRDIENLTWLTLVIGLLGCAVWNFFSPNFKEGETDPKRHLGVPTNHFSGADLMVLPMVLTKFSPFLLVMVVTFLVGLPHRFFAWLSGGSEVPAETPAPEETPAVEITPEVVAFNFILDLVLLALVMVMIQWVGQVRPSKIFGLRRLNWWKLVLWTGAGLAISLPLVLSMGWVSANGLKSIFGNGLEDQVAVQSLRESKEAPLLRFVLIVRACLVAPIVEEVIFRGYLYGVLKRFTGPMFAAFIGAALFAIAHDNLQVLLPLWGFAVVLTLFYEASRCLWVPIGMHAAFNVVQVYQLMKIGG